MRHIRNLTIGGGKNFFAPKLMIKNVNFQLRLLNSYDSGGIIAAVPPDGEI